MMIAIAIEFGEEGFIVKEIEIEKEDIANNYKLNQIIIFNENEIKC